MRAREKKVHKRYRRNQKMKFSVLTTKNNSLQRVYGLVRPMIRKIIRPSIIVFAIMLSLGFLPSTQPEMIQVNAVKAQSESPLIEIQEVNLEVEKDGKFVELEELTLDEPTTGQTTLTPQVVNNSKLRVNVSYSTIIGNEESIVIHSFAVEVYEFRTGEPDNFTKNAGISEYEKSNPEELVLPPNSSKSEVLQISSLALPTYGNYKFAFKVEYHVYGGDSLASNVYFAKNMSFEFVESLPESPYVLYFLFYTISIVFIAFVALGVYGDRRYKNLEI
jgi:hypothetical protein